MIKQVFFWTLKTGESFINPRDEKVYMKVTPQREHADDPASGTINAIHYRPGSDARLKTYFNPDTPVIFQTGDPVLSRCHLCGRTDGTLIVMGGVYQCDGSCALQARKVAEQEQIDQ